MKNKLILWKKRDRQRDRQREPQWDAHPVSMLHREVNELFDNFFKRPGQLTTPFGSTTGFELSETDDEIRVKADFPGLDEKDIQISLEGSMLTIRGEHREEKEEKMRKYHVSKMSYGSCCRSVPLPAEVDATKAKAKFKRGVLTLDLPKTEQAKTERKRIPVSGS